MVPPPGGLLATSRDLERGKRDGLAGVSLLLRECTSIIKWISGLWETWQTKQPLLTSVQGGRRMCCTANELQPHPQPRLGKPAWHARRQRAKRLLIASSRPGEFGSFPGLFRAITTIEQ